MVERLGRILMALSATGLAVMAAILCWQVFARYVLGSSPAWAEQSALLLMIWIVFLGAAAGVAQGFHVRIAEGVERMSPAWAKRVIMAANTLILIFALMLFFWGAQLVIATWHNQVPTLPVNRGAVYAVIPLSGVLIAVFVLDHWCKGKETGGSSGI